METRIVSQAASMGAGKEHFFAGLWTGKIGRPS